MTVPAWCRSGSPWARPALRVEAGVFFFSYNNLEKTLCQPLCLVWHIWQADIYRDLDYGKSRRGCLGCVGETVTQDAFYGFPESELNVEATRPAGQRCSRENGASLRQRLSVSSHCGVRV